MNPTQISPPCPGWQAIPPDTLPLNPAVPRPTPQDRDRLMSYTTRQLNGTDPLCEWCLRRELAYWSQFHWSHEGCALATARDVACWQLQRTESDALSLLAALDLPPDFFANYPPGAAPKPKITKPTDPWLHIAMRIVGGEFDSRDLSTKKALRLGLVSNQHPVARAAFLHLEPKKRSRSKPQTKTKNEENKTESN